MSLLEFHPDQLMLVIITLQISSHLSFQFIQQVATRIFLKILLITLQLKDTEYSPLFTKSSLNFLHCIQDLLQYGLSGSFKGLSSSFPNKTSELSKWVHSLFSQYICLPAPLYFYSYHSTVRCVLIFYLLKFSIFQESSPISFRHEVLM